MSQPTQYQILDADKRLTNLSIALMSDTSNFVAGRLFPTVPVQQQAGKFVTYKSGDFNRTDMQITADGAPAPLTGFGVGEDNYFCDVYKEGSVIGPATIANATAPFQVRSEMATLLTRHALIFREKKFHDNYIKAGVWASDWTGVATNPSTNEFIKFSDYTNSDPIVFMAERLTSFQLLNSGVRPNKLLISRDVLDTLKNHPAIIERIIYIAGNEPAIITEQHLSKLFGVEVMVMDSVYNAANEGAAESNAFFSSGEMLLLYTAPSASLMTDSAGFIFSWNAFSGYGGSAIRREARRLSEGGGEYMEIQQAYDMKVRNANMGVFFTAVI